MHYVSTLRKYQSNIMFRSLLYLDPREWLEPLCRQSCPHSPQCRRHQACSAVSLSCCWTFGLKLIHFDSWNFFLLEKPDGGDDFHSHLSSLNGKSLFQLSNGLKSLLFAAFVWLHCHMTFLLIMQSSWGISINISYCNKKYSIRHSDNTICTLQ